MCVVIKQYGFIDVLTRLKYGRFDRILIILALVSLSIHQGAGDVTVH